MAVPVAVAPSVLTPGVYLTVDLLAGTSSPSTGVLRVALMAPKSSVGDLTVDTEVRAGTGEASANTAFGVGTVGHLGAKGIYSKFPAAQVDFIAPTAGTGTATLDLTLSGVPTSDNIISLDVMGREFEVSWPAAATADATKTDVINAILQRTDDLACTASSGGVGVVTVDSKGLGGVGEDILIKASIKEAVSGTEAIAGAATHTPLAAVTTDPDFTTALASISGREYHYIVTCLSNQDIDAIGGTNNAGRAITHVDSLNTGLNSKLQQVIAGYTGSTVATAVLSALDADSFGNSEKAEMIMAINGRGLPGELAGRECGGRLAAISVDPAANRIGELLDGYVGSHDEIADDPTASESEAGLGGGVSLVGFTAQGAERLIRAVTTHSQDDAGGADRRLLDTQNVDAEYIVARDIRDNIALEFPQAKITKDKAAGEDPPPPGVVEERDIKGWVTSRLRSWEKAGVVEKAALDAAILPGGGLIVQVNASDATQVDIVLPKKIIQPLAKFGIVSQRLPS